MTNATQKLLDYQKQGYLFHGSPRAGLKELIPKQSHDVDKKQSFNIDKAVFATDEPNSAVIFGIVDPKKFHKSGEWTVRWKGEVVRAIVPKEWVKKIKKLEGYVYVLNRNDFPEKVHKQYKSNLPVKPIDCIKVSFQDFIYTGGKLLNR